MFKPNFRLIGTESGTEYSSAKPIYRGKEGELLDVELGRPVGFVASLKKTFDRRSQITQPLEDQSGVWRYRELVLPLPENYIVSQKEGNTNVYESKDLANYAGLESIFLKHEGQNPTGSFKDRGMTTGITMAQKLGARAVACASTGNTSASMASYAATLGIPAFVFVPEGKITQSKLAQAVAYGAQIIQVAGDFDTAMNMVEQVALEQSVYLLNSLNPFRLAGQRSIAIELLHQLQWQPPDWVVVPGGNLGNTSAIGQALLDLYAWGFIAKVPRLITVQADGANPFYQSYQNQFATFLPQKAQTVASAIQIGNPVSYPKAKKVIEATHGVVFSVSDQALLEAKGHIDKAGIGCEPASAVTLAGVKALVKAGTVARQDTVVLILTGHVLKDPDVIFRTHRIENIIHKTTNQKDISKIIQKALL